MFSLTKLSIAALFLMLVPQVVYLEPKPFMVHFDNTYIGKRSPFTIEVPDSNLVNTTLAMNFEYGCALRFAVGIYCNAFLDEIKVRCDVSDDYVNYKLNF